MADILQGPKMIYVGQYADDATATAAIVVLGWDDSGNPRDGQFYFNTTMETFKGWNDTLTAWIGSGSTTPEGGLVTSLINKTGLPSAKGTIIEPDLAVDEGFSETTPNSFEAIAVVYENGIVDGSRCLVVVSGVADVLLENGTSSTRRNWVRTGGVPGRADMTAATPPGAVVQHFQEVGHCLETKISGVNVLAKAILHFN